MGAEALRAPCSPHGLAPPGKPLAFSESSLRDFMCSSRMIPTVSQRVGERSEGKALRIVPYKDVDINLELTASEGDGGTWN